MTYSSSEDAMEANEAVSLKAAQRELERHGMDCILDPARDGYIIAGNPRDASDPGESIPCTTKAILEWLGY